MKNLFKNNFEKQNFVQNFSLLKTICWTKPTTPHFVADQQHSCMITYILATHKAKTIECDWSSRSSPGPPAADRSNCARLSVSTLLRCGWSVKLMVLQSKINKGCNFSLCAIKSYEKYKLESSGEWSAAPFHEESATCPPDATRSHLSRPVRRLDTANAWILIILHTNTTIAFHIIFRFHVVHTYFLEQNSNNWFRDADGDW